MTLRTYFDGNSICHAAQARKSGKLYAGERETTAIFGGLMSVRKLLNQRLAARPIVLWDGRSWRHERFEDYKGNRTATAEQRAERAAYKAQRADIARGLHLLGLSQLLAGNMEADDLAAILTRKALAAGDQVILVTGDKDWLQLVQPGVVWIDHKLDRKGTVESFQELTGFKTTKAFVDGKGLAGEAGDNVKPNTGVGEDTAVNLFQVFEDADHFLRTPIDEAKALYKAHHGKAMYHGAVKFHGCPQAQERFRWALELMDLSHPLIPAPTKISGTKAKVDVEKFRAFCAEFAFTSILSNFDAWIQPFITLEEFSA